MIEVTEYDKAERMEIERKIQKASKWIAESVNQEFYFNQRGLMYQRLGNDVNALNDFNKCVELLNKSAEPMLCSKIKHYLNRADHYFFNMEKYDEAIKDYAECSKTLRYVSYLSYPAMFGDYMDIADHIELICDFRQAIKLDPENAEAYINRGIIYFRTEIYSKAINDFNQAIKFDSLYNDVIIPLLSICYRMNAKNLCEKKKSREAEKSHTEAIRLDPKNPQLYSERAYSYDLNSQFDNAIRDYTEAIKLDPSNPEFYLGLDDIYQLKGLNDEAEKNYIKVKKLNPEAVSFHMILFQIHLKKEDYTKASQDIKSFIKSGRHYITTESLSNRDRDGDGEPYVIDECLSYIESLCRAQVDEVITNGNKYRIIELSKKILYNVSVELYPKSFEMYLCRGIYYMELNNYKDAITDFSISIELYKGFIFGICIESIYFLRGICNDKIGKSEKANEDFNQVADGNFFMNPCNFNMDFRAVYFSLANFSSLFNKLDYSNFLIFIAKNFSIKRMLVSISSMFSIHIYLELFRLSGFLDKLDWKEIKYHKRGLMVYDDSGNYFFPSYNKRFEDLLSQIFFSYPNHEKSLEYLSNRDGKDSFFFFVKLSLLKLLLPVFKDAEKKSPMPIKDKISYDFSFLSTVKEKDVEEKSPASPREDKICEWAVKGHKPISENQRINFILLYNYLDGKGKERELSLLEKQKEQEKSELKTKIFQAVSHTISNIMLANKAITKRIKSGTSSMNDVNRLELLNDLVLSTMNAIKLAFSNQDIVLSRAQDELFCEKISDGISLHDLLWFCLNINLYYLVVGEGEEAWATIRNIFFSINRYDKKDVREKLAVLKEMRKSPHFSISELSEEQIAGFVNVFRSDQFEPIHRFFDIEIEELGNLYVKKNSYTFSVLFIILLELTKNMIRYGTIEDRTARRFIVKSETEGDYIVLTLANACRKSRLNLKESTLKGLAMIQEFSKVVGKFEQSEKDMEDSELLEFAARLFIKRPEGQETAK
ncbi:tetratricopeptide repeat protein [Desulfococcaceae bacterium HSG8]|nr:tetratricopeptide repeat protein [Desulfococcaceae bacterium HSG8]